MAWQALTPLHVATALPGSRGDLGHFTLRVCSQRWWLFSIMQQTFWGTSWNKALQRTLPARTHRHAYSLRPKWEDFCISELQELSVLEGVGCALAGKGPGSGADEIISSTPSDHGSPQLNNMQSDACLNRKQSTTFLASSTESPTARCARMRFRINIPWF